MHVLVVDVEEDVAVLLARLFEAAGFDTAVEVRGDDTLAHVEDVDTDMVILDPMLPDMDGLEVCSLLRRGGFDGGLIMVSSRCQEIDVVAGLDAGADDYLVKPVSIAELQSRVRSVLRRVHRTHSGDAPPAGDGGALEVGVHQITYGGVVIVTAGREYDVLALLVAHHGRVVPRHTLMDQVWGTGWAGSPMVLASSIGRIRARLAAAGAAARIENVRGVGFRLSSDDDQVPGPRSST